MKEERGEGEGRKRERCEELGWKGGGGGLRSRARKEGRGRGVKSSGGREQGGVIECVILAKVTTAIKEEDSKNRRI